MPACTEEILRGVKIGSSRVSMVLKVPIEMKLKMSTSTKGFLRKSALIEAKAKSSLEATGPGGGTRGFSLVNTMAMSAATTATKANTQSTAGIPPRSASRGDSTIAKAKPTY